MSNNYYSLVTNIEETKLVIKYLNEHQGITVIFIPLTFEVYVYLFSKGYNIETPSKYFNNKSHERSIEFVDKIRHNAKSGIDSDYLWKEYRHYISFNVSYIIFIIEILEALSKKHTVTFLLSGMYSLTKNYIFLSDVIVSRIVQLYSVQNNIKNINIINFKKQIKSTVTKLDYKLEYRDSYRDKVFVPYLGYNIDRVVKLLKNSHNIKSFYLRYDNSFTTLLRRLYYYVAFRMTSVLCNVTRTKCKPFSKLLVDNSEFNYNGVDFSSIVVDKLDMSYVYYSNQENMMAAIKKFYSKEKPFLSIVYQSRGVADSISYFAKDNGCSALCISHGTVSPFYNRYDKLYKKYIAESVILNNYPTVAIQSPIANSFFSTTKSDSIRIKTGNIIFASASKIGKFIHRFKTKKTIVHAVTLKGISNIQFIGSHIYDEFIKEIIDLQNVLGEEYNFIVQVHPHLKDVIKKYHGLFPGIKFNYGKISKILNKTDLLISFSSTAIEDALNCKIPVLLYDGVSRYKHCDCLDLDKDNFSPYPVYYTNHISTIRKHITSMVCNKGIDWNTHIYSESYSNNLHDYFSDVCSNTK